MTLRYQSFHNDLHFNFKNIKPVEKVILLHSTSHFMGFFPRTIKSQEKQLPDTTGWRTFFIHVAINLRAQVTVI